MFGIGLPELIVIMALALIVVGPDKLPDLARSVAKGILELKKTANTLKESLTEDGNPLDDIKPELEKAAKALTSDVMGESEDTWTETDRKKIYDPRSTGEKKDSTIIDVNPEEPEEKTVNKQEVETDTQSVDHSKTEEINKKQADSEQKE
jgi:sec-independent protein translocase protein TatB